MNCTQIREAIDQARRRAGYSPAVQSHLSGCPDCRQHANEASSLLELLSAAPRVEVPADFEFHLRARIARAKAEKNQAGVLESFWKRSFSFGQAATALAAIAVTMTFYFNHKDEMATTVKNDIAVVASVTSSDESTASQQTEAAKPNTTLGRRVVIRTAIPKAAAASSRAAKPIAVKSDAIANLDDVSRVYANGRVISTSINRDTIVGAEGAVVAKANSLSF
jgi:hypothetical protein